MRLLWTMTCWKTEKSREMDKFLETYNWPTLNHEEIENVNILTTSKEIELVIKNLSASRSPGPDGCTSVLYQTFKESTPILPSQTLPRNRRTTSKLILQGLHYPNSKTRQGQCKKRKSQANIPDEHKWENLQQNVSKLNSTIL